MAYRQTMSTEKFTWWLTLSIPVWRLNDTLALHYSNIFDLPLKLSSYDAREMHMPLMLLLLILLLLPLGQPLRLQRLPLPSRLVLLLLLLPYYWFWSYHTTGKVCSPDSVTVQWLGKIPWEQGVWPLGPYRGRLVAYSGRDDIAERSVKTSASNIKSTRLVYK